jgi:hypothetical protein
MNPDLANTEDTLTWDTSGWNVLVKRISWTRLDTRWADWAGHWRWSLVNARTGEVAVVSRRALTERAAWRRSHRAYAKALATAKPEAKA